MIKTQKRRARRKLVKEMNKMELIPIIGYQEHVSPVFDYSQTSHCHSFANLKCKQQEKENTMNTLNIVAHAAQSNPGRSTEDRQKDHLVCRLNDIKYQRREVLRTQFGLDELPRPKTPAELVEYIKTGKYVFKHEEDLEDDDFGSSEFYYSPWRYIQFRDPEVKEDRAGYEKACKALEKLYDDTKDEIIVKNPEDALAALRQFESTSIN